MSHRTPSHCSAMSRSVSMTSARRAGANALSCTTSGQAGKYGSRPLASTEPSIATKDPGIVLEVLAAAAHEEFRVRARPRVVGCDVVGDEVQDEPQSVPGQRGAGVGQAVASTQARVDLVVGDAVRRPDNVFGSVVGQHGVEALRPARCCSARSLLPPRCAPIPPSATRRRNRRRRARPTARPARWTGRSTGRPRRSADAATATY